MASTRTELRTLKNLLSEADLILSTTELPEGRAVRCRELLRSALVLADDMLNSAKMPAAALLGRAGGTQTAKRGSDYFRQLAANHQIDNTSVKRRNVSDTSVKSQWQLES